MRVNRPPPTAATYPWSSSSISLGSSFDAAVRGRLDQLLEPYTSPASIRASKGSWVNDLADSTAAPGRRPAQLLKNIVR